MISRFFIDRPVFAAVISIVIVLAGFMAMRALPIEQYPEIVPPQVVVSASYPGASPEVLACIIVGAIILRATNGDKEACRTAVQASLEKLVSKAIGKESLWGPVLKKANEIMIGK